MLRHAKRGFVLALWVPLLVDCSSSGNAPLHPLGGDGAVASGDASTDAAEASYPIVTSDYRSGSRLRARILDGGGDARIFVGWHDAQLDVDCDFRPVVTGAPGDDGRWRCLPRTSEIWTQDNQDDIVYLDAACTHAVRVDRQGKGTSPYVVVPSARVEPTCFGPPQVPPATVFARGDQVVVASSTILYEDGGHGCAPSLATGRSLDAFELGAKASVAAFVGASEIVEPRSDRLAARVRVADDGARETIGVHDRRRNAACDTGTAYVPAHGLCLPFATIQLDQYDATCAKGVAEAPEAATCAPLVEIASVFSPTTCSDTTSFYQVGAPFDGPRAYISNMDTGPTCVANPTTTGRYFAQGPLVPAGTYPSIAVQGLGDGPLRRECIVPADGTSPLFCHGLTDPERGSCLLLPFCDGQTRCVGSGVDTVDGSFFADAACTRRVLGLPRDACGKTKAPAPLILEYSGANAACQDDELVTVVGPYTGPLFMRDASNVCAVVPVAKGLDLYDVAVAGSAASLLPAVTARTE